MKYGLIIQDLTADETAGILEQLHELNQAGEKKAKPLVATTVTGAISGETQTFTTGNMTEPSIPNITVEVQGKELDKNNLPWDERIHAGSKKQNANGSWKKRKGVDDETINAVEAELKGNVPSVAATFVAPAPVTPIIAQSPAAMPVTPIIAQPAPAPVAVQTIERDFKGLMQEISNLFAKQQIDPAYLNGIVQRINEAFNSSISTLTDVASNPQMVEYTWQCLEVDGKKAA